MDKKDRILLFIPMYNCEKQITRVLSQINDEACKYITECIIVNNRSTDGSEAAVIGFLTEHKIEIPVILHRNHSNYSLGGSHKVAFNYAIKYEFDYVIVLHGDDQGNIHDLLPMIADGSAKKFDSFLGSRFDSRSTLTNYSGFRIFGNHVFNEIFSMVAGRRLTDLGSGLNFYKTSYLKSKFYLPFQNDLSFNVYMLLYGVHIGSDFSYFPLTWREHDQVSNAKLIQQTGELSGLIIKYLFNKNELFRPKENEFSNMVYTSEVIFPGR